MDNALYIVKVAAYIGAALVMGIGSVGPALGMGMVGSKACESIGKNKESAGAVRTSMVIAIGFIESIAVYCLLIALFLTIFS